MISKLKFTTFEGLRRSAKHLCRICPVLTPHIVYKLREARVKAMVQEGNYLRMQAGTAQRDNVREV